MANNTKLLDQVKQDINQYYGDELGMMIPNTTLVGSLNDKVMVKGFLPSGLVKLLCDKYRPFLSDLGGLIISKRDVI